MISTGTLWKEKFEDGDKKMFSSLDMLHILLLLACRVAIIAIKYGFYSREHFHILQQIRYPNQFLLMDLISTQLFNDDPDIIKKRILFAVEQLGIEPSSLVIECSK
jgi:hypothetical protein